MTPSTERIKAVKQNGAVPLHPPEHGDDVVLMRGYAYDEVSELLEDWDPRLLREHMAEMMRDDWDCPFRK
jgi:hypothetical protein